MSREVNGSVNVLALKFKWEINNFSITCPDMAGDRLESPKFTCITSVIRWHMRLSIPEDDEDYLSICLCSDFKIKAVISFIIFNNKGEVMVSDTVDKRVVGCMYTRYSWRSRKFVLRDFITNPVNGILNDDKVTIVCKIRYENSEMKYNKGKKHELEDKYEALLEDCKFSDVSLIAEGKAVKAHKCILAKSSSVFAAMFDSEIKEKQDNTVEITDIEYDVLVEMIRFIYASKVNNIDTLAGELAVAADKYALDKLKKKCEKTMIKNLNVDNVIGCLRLADSLCMDKLKENAIEIIVKNNCDVSSKPEFNLLPSDIRLHCLANKKA